MNMFFDGVFRNGNEKDGERGQGELNKLTETESDGEAVYHDHSLLEPCPKGKKRKLSFCTPPLFIFRHVYNLKSVIRMNYPQKYKPCRKM